jgi:hypothetical protein
VAEEQADLFRNLDVTFSALASVARPFLQETISRSVPAMDVAIDEFPRQRPFLRNTAAFFRELRPGVATLPRSAPLLADAFAAGRRTLPRTPSLNRRLDDVFFALEEFNRDERPRRGIARLTRTSRSLRPTLSFLTPVETTCKYVSLLLRNASSLVSQGDHNGTWQRFIVIAAPAGPNAEGGPSRAPANGPAVDNHLHAIPYPNTASPGQVRECEAGNEPYQVGRTIIGNVPGNQGTNTGRVRE